MKKNDVRMVFDVLNDCADNLKDKVKCLQHSRKHNSDLFVSVQKSDLSSDDKFGIQCLIRSVDSDHCIQISDMLDRINSIDLFVAELSEWLKYDHGTCIMCKLDDEDEDDSNYVCLDDEAENED